jgi:hypothetical protein
MAAPLTSTGSTAAEHRFFTAMTLAILATVFVGFSRSFFLRPMFPDWPAPHEAIFYVHGAVFAGWIGLLLVQTALVAGGRTDLHRKVGALGALLAVAMLILGTVGALIAARRATGFVGVPVPPLQFLAVPLFDMVLFPAFVALALSYRRRPQYHKRLMLLATIVLTTAAIARWPGVLELGPPAFFGLTDLFVVALAIWDRRVLGRLHPVTLWGGAALIVSQPLRLVVSGTDAWLVFARWATGLLG